LLKNVAFENEVPISLFEEFLKNYEILQSKCVTQLRTKKNKCVIKSAIEQCTYSNKITQKKIFKKRRK
jgi:hypothetical protein